MFESLSMKHLPALKSSTLLSVLNLALSHFVSISLCQKLFGGQSALSCSPLPTPLSGHPGPPAVWDGQEERSLVRATDTGSGRSPRLQVTGQPSAHRVHLTRGDVKEITSGLCDSVWSALSRWPDSHLMIHVNTPGLGNEARKLRTSISFSRSDLTPKPMDEATSPNLTTVSKCLLNWAQTLSHRVTERFPSYRPGQWARVQPCGVGRGDPTSVRAPPLKGGSRRCGQKAVFVPVAAAWVLGLSDPSFSSPIPCP